MEFTQFFLILSLLAARETGRTTQFLYFFSPFRYKTHTRTHTLSPFIPSLAHFHV
jgi:hypothetical protein